MLKQIAGKLKAVLHADHMGTQALANCLWAISRAPILAEGCQHLVPMMAERVSARAGDFNPQELSNIILATASMGKAAPEELVNALSALAEQARGPSRNFRQGLV